VRQRGEDDVRGVRLERVLDGQLDRAAGHDRAVWPAGAAAPEHAAELTSGRGEAALLTALASRPGEILSRCKLLLQAFHRDRASQHPTPSPLLPPPPFMGHQPACHNNPR